MKTFVFLSIVLFYVSLGFLLEKAGYNIIIIIILIIGIIFLPIRNLLMTLIYIYLPFTISYYYSQKLYVPIITLVLPFLGYPYMALRGYYNDNIR